MSLSLAIPQLFYDFIARVLPGFLFLFVIRISLRGTSLDPDSIVTLQGTTSVENVFKGLGFLVLCYFVGRLLRGLRWPSLEPKETTEFRTMYQRVRLQHPESGFRLVKLRAEARLLEVSRTGLVLASGLAFTAWISRYTELGGGEAIHTGEWVLRIGLPLLVGLIFLTRESSAWGRYQGNVRKLHSLIVNEGYPKEKMRGSATAEVPA